jgi:poly(3-hydroxybutyrate) depolymerase
MFKSFASEAHDWAHVGLKPAVNRLAALTEELIRGLPPSWQWQFGWKLLHTTANVWGHLTRPYPQPNFDILMIDSQDGWFNVEEVVIPEMDFDFGQLIHFKTRRSGLPQLILVTAKSGHFATLMRETVETLLQDFDVYVAVWKDPRHIEVDRGDFGFGDYVTYCRKFFEHLGQLGDTHVMAVCQPGPAVLAALALMSEDQSPYLPKTFTVLAAPMDTRASPSAISVVANLPLSVFETVGIHPVPSGYRGAGRRVYPGHLQLTGFMLANPLPHGRKLVQYIKAHWSGDEETTIKIIEFYQEYFALMSATERFYLETVDIVFLNHLLPRGLLDVSGRRVNLGAIKDINILAIAAGEDDFCPGPQTKAVLKLCKNVSAKRKQYHLVPRTGHYGIFSGRIWQTEVYPLIRDFVTKAS